jgi:hypothetical protein
VVQPLRIDVRLMDLPTPDRVELDLAGYDMDMGYNRVLLEPVVDADADADTPGGTRFTGSGMLPVCVRDRMTWEARVLLYDGGTIRAAPFRFETVRGASAR